MSSEDWTSRTFLQSLLSRGSITFTTAKHLLTTLHPEVPPDNLPALLETLVTSTRRRLTDLDYDIVTIPNQETGEITYVFVNLSADPATQVATGFNVEELAFVKRVLDGMFVGNNSKRMEVMAVTKEQVVKLGRPAGGRQSLAQTQADEDEASQAVDRGITHGEVNRVMSILVASNWLKLSRNGFYTLSTRGLAELRNWLVDMYNDGEPGEWQRVKNCSACKEIITMGLRCKNMDCLGRLHDRCAEVLFKGRRGRSCPVCGGDWGEGGLVGERAVTEGRIWQGAHGGGGGGGGRRGRRQPVGIEKESESEAEEAEEAEEDMEGVEEAEEEDEEEEDMEGVEEAEEEDEDKMEEDTRIIQSQDEEADSDEDEEMSE